MQNYSALSHYQAVDVDCRVAASSPHNLVSLLFDGALKNIAIASGCIDRGEVAAKGRHISKAIKIIDNLRASLDMQQGGEIADKLKALYDYMETCLMEANLKNAKNKLEETSSLLEEIKSAWDSMPPEYRR